MEKFGVAIGLLLSVFGAVGLVLRFADLVNFLPDLAASALLSWSGYVVCFAMVTVGSFLFRKNIKKLQLQRTGA